MARVQILPLLWNKAGVGGGIRLSYWFELENECAQLQSEVNRLQVALDATIAEREKVKLRWIPVEERLPEKGNKLYLCAYKDGSIGITPYERFANGNFWTNGMRLAKGVTHWMPLPAPPKEVSK